MIFTYNCFKSSFNKEEFNMPDEKNFKNPEVPEFVLTNENNPTENIMEDIIAFGRKVVEFLLQLKSKPKAFINI